MTDLRLNQQVTLTSDVKRESRDVDGALVTDLTNHAVDQDVRASPTHTSAETRQDKNGMRCNLTQCMGVGGEGELWFNNTWG